MRPSRLQGRCENHGIDPPPPHHPQAIRRSLGRTTRRRRPAYPPRRGLRHRLQARGDARIVTFSNGITARERIIDVDDQQQRVAWSATGGRLSHHNASAQVFPATADTCEVVWIADLLPDEMEPGIAAMIDMGLAAMKRTLESAAR
jgi:hypothetical protein